MNFNSAGHFVGIFGIRTVNIAVFLEVNRDNENEKR